MSCKGDVFLPLITRLRHFSKLFSSSRNGKRKSMDRKGSNSTEISEVARLSTQILPDVDDPNDTDEHCSPPNCSSQQQKQHSGGPWQPFHLEKEGIRVLMFRECDTRGRKLLYDSKTVVQLPVGDASSGHSSRIFKSSAAVGGSWSSGTHLGGGGIGGSAPLARSPSPHPTAISSSSSNSKSSSTTSNPKSEGFAEISGGYGYQVSHFIVGNCKCLSA